MFATHCNGTFKAGIYDQRDVVPRRLGRDSAHPRMPLNFSTVWRDVRLLVKETDPSSARHV